MIDNLLAARAQMGVSLGFHIIFALVGMAMPLLMVMAELRYARTAEPVYLELAKRWAKGTAILFAVGAVSGTVLSFELGLLWPTFMEKAGPLIGMPFSLEGFAFFLEAIFLGIYLYGFERVSRRVHIMAGFAVAACGLASGVFVVGVNAWMNTPSGFTLRDGVISDIDYTAALFSPAFFSEGLHTALSSYTSVAFAVLAIHALRLLRVPNSNFHRSAAQIALLMALVATPLQIASGDLSAKHIAKHQPRKLAAAEGLFETQRGAPSSLGGWPDLQAEELRGAIHVPYVLSILATADPHGEVKGLKDFPRDEWPNVAFVHVCFQIMVGCGFTMLGLVAWALLFKLRKRDPLESRLFLWASVACGPLGVIAVEAGWCVTEIGRQPWIISGVMRTADAVTTAPNLGVPLIVILAVYAMLSVTVVGLLKAHVMSAPDGVDATAKNAEHEP